MSRRVPVLGAMLLALALALVVVACGSSSATVAPAASAPAGGALPAEVDVATAAAMQASGAFVLDVRQPDEWAAGHIDGATLIPLGELAARAASVPKDREVVVVCRSGNRSAQGRDILLGAGFPSVTSMAGGMNAWTAAGKPVVTGP